MKVNGGTLLSHAVFPCILFLPLPKAGVYPAKGSSTIAPLQCSKENNGSINTFSGETEAQGAQLTGPLPKADMNPTRASRPQVSSALVLQCIQLLSCILVGQR